jgi:hypothetical protein
MKKVICDVCSKIIDEREYEDDEKQNIVILQGDVSPEKFVSIRLETENDLCKECILGIASGKIKLETPIPKSIPGRAIIRDFEFDQFGLPPEDIPRDKKINWLVRNLDSLKSVETALRNKLESLG